MDAEEIHINGNGEMNMNDVENRSNSIVGIHALLSKGARVNAKSMVAVAATALMVGFVLPAYAQQAPAPASGAQDAAKVDEIVVTGALRRQRLQDAPVAVTSLPPTEFTHSGFKSAADLQFISPSVQVSIGGANAIYIRGSGTNNTNGSGEQSVGLVIDGVPMGFVDDIGGDISDLDRTEVYRGPQGTQFALNTSAGTVVMLTKNPQTGVTSTDLHLSYGEHNDTSNYVTQNIPLGDTFAGRLTASFQHRDGVYHNISTQQDEAERDQAAVRAKFLWKPRAGLSVLFNADARMTNESPNFALAWGACGPPTNGYYFGATQVPPCFGSLSGAIGSSGTGLNVNPENVNSAESTKGIRHTAAGGASLTVTYPIGDYTLTSISAFRFMTRHLRSPIGSGYYPSFTLNSYYNGHQDSEELRLSSPATGTFTYVGGLFFYDREAKEKRSFEGSDYGLAFNLHPNTPFGQNVKLSTVGGLTSAPYSNKSYAAYADGSLHLTTKLQINAGVRVTRDDISAAIDTLPEPGVFGLAPAQPLRSLSISNTGYTWRLGPQYFITPDVQLYGTWAHGYKGPLIDTSVNLLDAIKPEENVMLEAGLKSSWFEHRLTVNVTLFHEKYRNYQVTVLNTVANVFQLGNAGGAVAKGVELEVNGRLSDEWRVSGGLSYNDNYYTDYMTACWLASEPIKQATTGPNGCFVHPGQTAVSAQAAGTPMVNAPRYTWRTGLNYDHAFAGGMLLDAGATYLHRTTHYSSPMDPNLIAPGYGILNLEAGLSSANGKYRFGVYARNALDTFFVSARQAGGGGFQNVLGPEAVRTIGVSLDAKFD
jgi:iron complex outermembrane receptor protein